MTEKLRSACASQQRHTPLVPVADGDTGNSVVQPIVNSAGGGQKLTAQRESLEAQGDLFADHGRRGGAGPGEARPGTAGHGRRGAARPGAAWQGKARLGEAGEARPVQAWHGMAGPGEAGEAGLGLAGRGEARPVKAPREWRVRLPLPPSVNNLFVELSPQRRAVIAASMKRAGKKGRPPTRYVSAKYRAWRKLAELLICGTRPERFCRPVAVELAFTPPDRRRRDPDNHSKPVLDALVSGRVLSDDSGAFVRAINSRWLPPSKVGAGVLVTVSEIR
jgi:Holliday junction resolvase RusA-like endonuclease